ncbi:energy transducer TonB [Rufibacter sp. XAAS-G3-1]|uniref:energy transducer TonB n=1 Tax=Rufibacter sp. XAAS-G3-1 TaxID=2729134 RepID=UPI0015E77F7F|nr:energy transducer TonB [Rufibacter sp. XAAS-G3-1]
METNTAYAATLDDLIFEGRNKAYGAYVLRKLYDRHISQATLYAIALFLIGFSVPILVNRLLPKAEVPARMIKPHTGTWVDIDLPHVEEIKEVKAVVPAAAQPTGPTVKNVTIKVVEETKPVTDEIPTQDQLQTASSGLVTSAGDGTGNLNNPEPSGGNGTSTATGVESGATETEVFISVENMPQFEGGLPKLMEFVSKNLRYPRAAQASGIEGTVVVSFVIATTGHITDIQVLKGLGYGTEEEAIRVMKKLPRWKPGNQNGRNVPVRMTLPIRLELK